MTDHAQRAHALPNKDGPDRDTDRVDVPSVPDRPCLRHGRARGHDTDQGEEVVVLDTQPCPPSLGTSQPIVLMSPAEAIALLRMAQRSDPQDAIEADVIAHLVKLAQRITDAIETRTQP